MVRYYWHCTEASIHSIPLHAPLEEEGDGAEEGGAEHEAVGDEDALVHAVVQRQLDEDLQRREDELHQHHRRRRPRGVKGATSRADPHDRYPSCLL